MHFNIVTILIAVLLKGIGSSINIAATQAFKQELWRCIEALQQCPIVAM